MRLPADNSAPSAARAYLHALLDRTQVASDIRDEVVLIASELVTNAVQSGSTYVDIDAVVSREQIVLTVDDDGRGWPTLNEAAPGDTSGRGLTIVDHLADQWEVLARLEGKRVLVARTLGL